MTAITTYPVRIPVKPEDHRVSALGQHQVSQYVVVRSETDAGIGGVGLDSHEDILRHLMLPESRHHVVLGFERNTDGKRRDAGDLHAASDGGLA